MSETTDAYSGGAAPGPAAGQLGGPKQYLTLGSFRSDEVTIKRSRFIGWGAPADSEDKALAIIEDIRRQHPQATHHCYAYRVGLGAETIRFNDDGEPAGTAGRPILEVLQREGLQNAVVVVTRYYGGTPLGAAGLVRAYARSAKLAVDAARIVRNVLHSRWRFELDYEAVGRVQHALLDRGIHIEETDYGERVHMQLLVETGVEDGVRALVRELTNGQATPTVVEQLYWPLALQQGEG